MPFRSCRYRAPNNPDFHRTYPYRTMDRPLLYIHGFASSGRSAKAALLRRHFARVYSPTLSHNPELALDTLLQFVELLGQPLLVGSSLGGLYAHYLSATRDLPAILINPALQPIPLLQRALGLQQSYADGSRFEFTAAHLQSLAQFQVTHPRPQRLLALLQFGDEVIDQHRTVELLPGARIVAAPGGDHGFQNLAEQMETIRTFGAAAE